MANDIIQPSVQPWRFSIERLIELLLDTTDFRCAWRSKVEIIANYLPPHADAKTAPRCVVRLGESFLRHSKGPSQGYGWDIYGDDFLYPELALLALYNAEPPHWLVRGTTGETP
jgi:hypothetical protein